MISVNFPYIIHFLGLFGKNKKNKISARPRAPRGQPGADRLADVMFFFFGLFMHFSIILCIVTIYYIINYIIGAII